MNKNIFTITKRKREENDEEKFSDEGAKRRKLSQEDFVIEKCSVVNYLSSEEKVCTVCFEQVEFADKFYLCCGHMFHLTCIKEWLKRVKICPICRKRDLCIKFKRNEREQHELSDSESNLSDDYAELLPLFEEILHQERIHFEEASSQHFNDILTCLLILFIIVWKHFSR